MKPGPKTQKLIIMLGEIIEIMSESGETHWVNYMLKRKILLENCKIEGISGLIGAYGGMGSFNDICFGPEFDQLRGAIYRLANEIWLECEVNDSR